MINNYIEQMHKKHIRLIRNFRATDINDSLGSDYFNNYLTYNGLLDNQQGIGKTFLYIRDTGKEQILLGFYTLRCSSLIVDDTENNEKLGEPAIEIFELAVHKDYQRQGIGSTLMKNIFYTAHTMNTEYLGVKHLIVCAKRSAIPFYTKFKFKELSDEKKIPRSIDNQACVGMSVKISMYL